MKTPLRALGRDRLAKPTRTSAAGSAPPSFSEALDIARRAWLTAMGGHAASPRHVIFPPTTAMLDDRHLEGCELLPSRGELIGKMTPGGVGAELGVEEGKFSRVILERCQPAELHLVDLDLSKYDLGRTLASYQDAGVITLHQGDSAETIRGFPPKYFDFIYVDGDHSYEGVARDIEASADRVKDDGFLIFNDYTYWSPWECMPYGVMQAVNEFCVQNDWRAVYFAFHPNMYCDIALRRRLPD